MTNAMLEKWTPEARSLEGDVARTSTPLHVLTGEAVDVARFVQKYYRSERDAQGNVTRPGLELAVNGGQFREQLGDEILELQKAVQGADFDYRMIVSAPDSPMAHAKEVHSELVAGLEFLCDDGVEDDDDVRLERLAATHGTPTSQDAMAAALDDYAAFAEMHRERLEALGAFDNALIDEAPALAKALRDQSALKLSGADKESEDRALDLRNRLVFMLYQRMQLVRAAARYVFRKHPDLVRKVTSAYQRQRVARYRAQKADGQPSGEEPNPNSPPTPTT